MNALGLATLIGISIIASIAAIGLVFHMGYLLRDIRDKLAALSNREPEPEPSVVTPLPPDYSNAVSASGIVTPKSPQQIEREEELRVQALK